MCSVCEGAELRLHDGDPAVPGEQGGLHQEGVHRIQQEGTVFTLAMGQTGDCDDARIIHRGCCKSLNVPRNNTHDSDYTKGVFPELFSWIRIWIPRKDFIIKKTR